MQHGLRRARHVGDDVVPTPGELRLLEQELRLLHAARITRQSSARSSADRHSAPARGDAVAVGRRLVDRSGPEPRPDRVVVGPEADRPAGERGGSEGRRLLLRGHLHRAAEQVGLELHQEAVRARAAVGAQHLDAAGKPVEHVRDLERDRLERGADEVGAGRPARDPADQAARLARPSAASRGRRAPGRSGRRPSTRPSARAARSPRRRRGCRARRAATGSRRRSRGSLPRARSRRTRPPSRAGRAAPGRARRPRSRARSCPCRRSPSPRRGRSSRGRRAPPAGRPRSRRSAA